jgi:hypothetical protein
MGREVPNEQDPDLAPEKARQLTESWRRKHPYAILRRPPTGQYNCHGMTLANRRTCVLDAGLVPIILKDDGYREARPLEAEQGDLVLYYDGREVTHTAVILSIERSTELVGEQAVRVISKWGQAGEYVHWKDDVPEVYRGHMAFWTDRP